MKLNLHWLKKYVDYKIDPKDLSHKLTMAGLEIEKSEVVDGSTVFDLEVTPNRPDCLNMIGLAREVSAILNEKLIVPKTKKPLFPKKRCDIQIIDKEGCSRYIGTLMNDVSISDVSKDVGKSLTPLGLRLINNVVDITNFCLMERGQPLHAFDYDKLLGGKILGINFIINVFF